MKVLILFSFLYLLAEVLLANKYDCIIAAKKYEEIYGIPKNLLLSVSLTESGRKIKNGEFVSWPWTINKKGKGKFFDNKASAVNYVKEYTKQGKKNILVICPGFYSDCVDTLEEISIQGKESFEKAGGEKFEFVPCLNDNNDHINLLEHLVKRNFN